MTSQVERNISVVYYSSIAGAVQKLEGGILKAKLNAAHLRSRTTLICINMKGLGSFFARSVGLLVRLARFEPIKQYSIIVARAQQTKEEGPPFEIEKKV